MALTGGELAATDGDGVGADHLDLEITGAQRHVDAEDPAAGPGHGDVYGQRFQRHRPHQLHGQTAQGEPGAGGVLGGAGDEGGHGAAVLVTGIPGTAGVLGRDEVQAALGEQRLAGLVGHPRRLVAPPGTPTSAGGSCRRLLDHAHGAHDVALADLPGDIDPRRDVAEQVVRLGQLGATVVDADEEL